MALAVAIGKIAISLLSAFAIVYFNFRGKQRGLLDDLHHLDAAGPGADRVHLQVVSDLGWVDTYWGLTVPLMASATATFLFRQFYQTIPN